MITFFKKIFTPSIAARFLFFFLSDILIILFSLYLSFLFRFDFNIPHGHQQVFIRALPLFLIVKLFLFTFFRMYRITWSYIGIKDFSNIVNAVVVSEFILAAFILMFSEMPQYVAKFFPSYLNNIILSPLRSFPRTIYFIDSVPGRQWLTSTMSCAFLLS